MELLNQRPSEAPQPIRLPQGFMFTEQNFNQSMGFTLFFALIWCSMSFPWFMTCLLEFMAEPNAGTLWALLFISPFAGIGVCLIGWLIRSFLITLILKPGDVFFSSYPLRMGESFAVRYRRELRHGSTTGRGQITAKWRCYEWIQYKQGTDIETKTHTLWEKDLPVKTVEVGLKRLEYEADLRVLSEGPPSFYADNNQVRWELEIALALPKMPKAISHFQFQVVPERVTILGV